MQGTARLQGRQSREVPGECWFLFYVGTGESELGPHVYILSVLLTNRLPGSCL